MGTGACFGLLAALVGVILPGTGPAVAVSNAFGKGPIVFHIPQSAIDRIRERAMEGDSDFQQLHLDLHRCPLIFFCTLKLL